MSVFGSAARGDDHPDSDIDFLVDLEPGASLLDLMRIQDVLQAVLGGPSDQVLPRAAGRPTAKLNPSDRPRSAARHIPR